MVAKTKKPGIPGPVLATGYYWLVTYCRDGRTGNLIESEPELVHVGERPRRHKKDIETMVSFCGEGRLPLRTVLRENIQFIGPIEPPTTEPILGRERREVSARDTRNGLRAQLPGSEQIQQADWDLHRRPEP